LLAKNPSRFKGFTAFVPETMQSDWLPALTLTFHEPERHLSPALSPNKLAERESTVAVNS
jgi:hypothetical protein